MQTYGKNKRPIIREVAVMKHLTSAPFESLSFSISIIAKQNKLNVFVGQEGITADEEHFIKATRILVSSILNN